MKWFIKENSIVLFFHAILLFGLLMLLDYYLFANMLNIIPLKFLLIILALMSGVGVLFALNSILHLLKTIKKLVQNSNTAYKQFAQMLVTIAAGALITLPGISTLILGWILYFKPVRIIVANLYLRFNKISVTSLYSYFLAEYINTN